MSHTLKKRIHLRLSCEAIAALDNVVQVANKTTARRGLITRSDITENIILKYTRNSLLALDDEIERKAAELGLLTTKRDELIQKKKEAEKQKNKK